MNYNKDCLSEHLNVQIFVIVWKLLITKNQIHWGFKYCKVKRVILRYILSQSAESVFGQFKEVKPNWKNKFQLPNQTFIPKKPSSIHSWSISHILEHEFFCLGRLDSSGSKEKKWIWVFLSNFWGWFFQILWAKKIFKKMTLFYVTF